MNDLALLLIVAAVGFGLARWLRLPVIPLLMGLGILTTVSGAKHNIEMILNTLELGLTFLAFIAGIELNPRRFGHQLKIVLWVSLLQFIAIGLIGFGIAVLGGFDDLTSLYLAIALSASSTLVIVRQLKQHQQMFEPFGRLVMGVLLLQDLIVIICIIVMARAPEGLVPVMAALSSGVVLAALAVLCQRWVMPWIVNRLKLDEETLLLSFLAVLFAFSGLAYWLGLPVVVGAFLGGFSLAAFPVSGLVRGQLNSLSDFFLALFFTALGAVIILPDWTILLHALAFAVVVILVTPPLVTVFAEWNGFSTRSAIESGLLLAQTSEFSLVVGLTGVALGHITLEVFTVIALVAIITMTLTPFVATDTVTRWLMRLHPVRRRLKTAGAARDHVLLLGFGSGGMWVLKPLRAAGHEVLVVDDDPIVIEQLLRANVACIRGDGSDEKILQKAGANQARLIIAAMRRFTDAEKVLEHVQGVPVIVRVFEESEAERIRSLGGIPILNSHASIETFMEWYEKVGRGHVRSDTAAAA